MIKQSPKNGTRIVAAPQETVESVRVPAIEIGNIVLRIKGEETLICHNWSEKSKREMMQKQMKQARVAKDAKDPFADFLGSLYPLTKQRNKGRLNAGESWPYAPNAYGFPAIAFKKAAIAACGFIQGITKVLTKGAIRVPDGLLPLKYSRLVMREDMVRIGNPPNQVADIRFRGEFVDWSVELPIKFMKQAINVEQIVNLMNHAGFCVGVGEDRPSSPKTGGGVHGTFTVEGVK